MSSAAVTYNFTNGTTADATQVNQNFTDLVGIFNSHALHRDAGAIDSASYFATGVISSGSIIADAAGVAKYAASGDNGKKIAFGLATINQTNGQAETTTVITTGVTLGTSTPAVLISQWDSGGGGNSYIVKVTARSATQITVATRKPDNSVFGANATIQVFWLVIG